MSIAYESVTKEAAARAFDEWLRLYTKDPQGFQSLTKCVLEAREQRVNGEPLTYGEECADYLFELVKRSNHA